MVKHKIFDYIFEIKIPLVLYIVISGLHIVLRSYEIKRWNDLYCFQPPKTIIFVYCSPKGPGRLGPQGPKILNPFRLGPQGPKIFCYEIAGI